MPARDSDLAVGAKGQALNSNQFTTLVQGLAQFQHWEFALAPDDKIELFVHQAFVSKTAGMKSAPDDLALLIVFLQIWLIFNAEATSTDNREMPTMSGR